MPAQTRPHLSDSIRLWQGDSIGHWEAIHWWDTGNRNDETWLKKVDDVIGHAAHVVERFTLAGPDTIKYQATVADPVVYTRPWTIAFPIMREKGMMYEAPATKKITTFSI